MPSITHAQQKSMSVIGYLHFATADYAPGAKEFLQGLQEKGYVEGKNVALEWVEWTVVRHAHARDNRDSVVPRLLAHATALAGRSRSAFA